MKPTSVMVTGGTGFLGSYVAYHIALNRGCDRVVVFDRNPRTRALGEVGEALTYVAGDVNELEDVVGAMEQHDVDRVVHLAFAVGEPGPGHMVPYVRVQCMGTVNVLEAARTVGVRRVVLGSSVAAYGRKGSDQVLTEDLPPSPDHVYGSAKVFTEDLARWYVERHGLEIPALRFGSIYGLGRGNRGSYRSGILAADRAPDFRAAIEVALRGGAVTMPGSEAVADFCYALDAAEAVWLALSADTLEFPIYNVTAERRPLRDFTECFRALLPDADVTMADAGIGAVHQLMSTDRIRKSLGFRPVYTLETGLADYLARARAAFSLD